MKPLSCIAAGAIAAASMIAFSGAANAAQFVIDKQAIAPGAAKDGSGLVHKVSGCHRGYAYHFVPRWGFPGQHRHVGPNCWPQGAGGGPGWGGGPGFGGGWACHHNWQNHWHPGFGAGWHRHSSRNCQPRRGRRWRGGPKTGCINLGGVWICG